MDAYWPSPSLECDIIMKGGITSGVVYPKAILALAERYRFRCIGGTSAGAIAAGLTAACEFNRAGGGFKTIEKVPGFLSENLTNLFQPTPELAPFYELLLNLRAKHSTLSRLVLVARHQLTSIFNGKGLGNTFKKILPNHYFGMCSGLTQPDHKTPGLTNWLAEQIEVAAGRMQSGGDFPHRPLTFGDLWKGALVEDFDAESDVLEAQGRKQISLSMVTTNLSMKRPNALPYLDDKNFFFRISDFEKLFPKFAVDYMAGSINSPHPYGDEFRHFPIGPRMPVIVAVRMSLSFPFLFTAVPLFRRNFNNRSARDDELELTLFSDGGLTSNFPIHFFDALLPSRPTFGISLDNFDAGFWPKNDTGQLDDRVFLPMDAAEGQSIAIQKIEGVMGFLLSLFSASKDWQDQLQGVLPGYRERVAHIALTEDEGGLNLTMPPEKIGKLVSFGEKAGERLIGSQEAPQNERFDFDEHRWRRALVTYARLEQSLEDLAEVWQKPVRGESFAEFLTRYCIDPGSYKEISLEGRREVISRLAALAELGEDWSNSRIYDYKKFPKPSTNLRITPHH